MKFVCSPENYGPKSCQSHWSSRSQWDDVGGSVLQTEKHCVGTRFPPRKLGGRLLSGSNQQL